MINEDSQLAVKRGACYMDENHPGWASKINFDLFDMSNCQQCVVGQAIGKYGDAIAQASGSWAYSSEGSDWAIGHGFDVTAKAFDESENGVNAYIELETLWTEQVRERLS